MPSASPAAILASDPAYEQQTAAALRIGAQLARRDDAIKRLRRENERLDLIVAESVSAQPASPAWYLSAGILTPAQAQSAASLTDLGLHKLMERHRRRATSPTNASGRGRGGSQRAARGPAHRSGTGGRATS